MSYRAVIDYLDDFTYIENSVVNVASPTIHSAYDRFIHQFEEAMRTSFSGEQNAIRTKANNVVERVCRLHRSGHAIAATDTLLQHVVELLDKSDPRALNFLIGTLSLSLCQDLDICDDRGLARLHNVLALTVHYHASLPSRRALRSAYHACVSDREGRAAQTPHWH